jgi:hypothetical protein
MTNTSKKNAAVPRRQWHDLPMRAGDNGAVEFDSKIVAQLENGGALVVCHTFKEYLPLLMQAKNLPCPPRRAKLAWAIVLPGGVIDVETITNQKTRTKDMLNLADEEQGAKVRRVSIMVVD